MEPHDPGNTKANLCRIFMLFPVSAGFRIACVVKY